VIINYLNTRLRPISFLALALLLSLFVKTSSLAIGEIDKVVFLFYSFLVFRLLDDAGSVFMDRLNKPERSYLSIANYPKFLRFTAVNIFIYVGGLAIFVSFKDASIIFLFLLISVGAYLLFKKSEKGLALIALLKYPFLMWCAIGWQNDAISLSLVIASFFLMAAHDLLEKHNDRSYLLGLLSLVLSGVLIFQIWQNPYTLVHIVPVLLIALIFRKSVIMPIAPILIYPLIYFLST
jgi:hypothetical protein